MPVSPKIPNAPISSEVNSQTYQMWFESLGRHAELATNIKSILSPSASEPINYVVSGAITHITYTGLGGLAMKLPNTCKYKAIIPVSDGTRIYIEAGSKTIIIPKYETEVTIHGNYFNA